MQKNCKILYYIYIFAINFFILNLTHGQNESGQSKGEQTDKLISPTTQPEQSISRQTGKNEGENTTNTKEQKNQQRQPSPQEPERTFKIEDIIKAIKALKLRISRTEKKMDEIAGVVLESAEGKESKLKIIHRNEMTPDFKLVKVVFRLDGAPIYKKSNEDGLMPQNEEVEIFNGAVLPGKHSLSMTFIYRGSGYGIMSYLSKYKFKVNSRHNFKVKEGQGLQIKVVAFEKGDINTKIEDRPAVKFIENKF